MPLLLLEGFPTPTANGLPAARAPGPGPRGPAFGARPLGPPSAGAPPMGAPPGGFTQHSQQAPGGGFAPQQQSIGRPGLAPPGTQQRLQYFFGACLTNSLTSCLPGQQSAPVAFQCETVNKLVIELYKIAASYWCCCSIQFNH